MADNARLRALIRDLLPPMLVRLTRPLRSPPPDPDWEYRPEGWSHSPDVRGWDVPEVAERQADRWPALAKAWNGPGPFSSSPEKAFELDRDIATHNTLMCFAYVVALAVRQRRTLSALDWGGGIGQYWLLARAALADAGFTSADLDYHVVDVPSACEVGGRVAPSVSFHTTMNGVQGRTFDLVVASGSLQYAHDWPSVLAELAAVTSRYLYVTRLPLSSRAPSFVVVQRPHRYGYDTEYQNWILNRDEVLTVAARNGMELVREFVIDEQAAVQGAPETSHYGGFLFRPRGASSE